jgi:hypothetical protein
MPATVLALLHKTGQRFAEARQAQRRLQLLASDEAFERGLAFCDFSE